jgi:copper homeostasis protein
MPRVVEICVTDTAGARAAEAGGADRVELCADLASGGITPSFGLIQSVVNAVKIPVHVLIRPRPGDFAYDPDEVAIMISDIGAARRLGAAGVVLGVLLRDGSLNIHTTSILVDHARPLCVTSHKAFDLARDPRQALETLIHLRLDRVLTSGGPGPARDNAARLRSLVEQAAGRIAVMAGGSIAEGDLPGLLDETGVAEIHVGSGVTGPAPEPGPFGSRAAPVESERVRRVVSLVHTS